MNAIFFTLFLFVHSIYYLNFIIQGIEKFDRDLSTLHPILAECHVQKSNLELSLIQFANDISSEAHVKVSSLHTSEKKWFSEGKSVCSTTFVLVQAQAS